LTYLKPWAQVGAVLVSKEYNLKEAQQNAKGLIENWNSYLSGDAYLIVKEDYDHEKQQIDFDSMGGFYGYKFALAELKNQF